jgi:two-component system, cell cycle sensor histidine kinase and response regulator CckA
MARMSEVLTEIEKLQRALTEAEAERDYYRLVSERQGQKALSDVQDFSRMIRNLRQTQEKLRLSQEELEKTVAERTAELVTSDSELRQSTSRYQELVRSIPNGVYVMRFSTNGTLRFEYLSPQFCQILDLNADAVLRDANVAKAIVHPEDLDSLEKANQDANRRMIPFRWEGRFLVWGEIRWIRLESNPTMTSSGDVVWNGVMSDITERRLTEEKLKESEELYRLLTEMAPNSITVADGAGIIRMVNPKALELFGHTHESEGVGINFFKWVSAESQEAARASFQKLLSHGSTVDLELKLLRKDGSEFAAVVNSSLLRDSQGQPKLVIIVISDITQQKRAEAERLKLQKLEAIGTLAGGIAHDFNNLLQGVFGYIAMARLKLDHKKEATAMLEQAEQAMSQSINLTSQLLTFAKGGTPVKKKLALRLTVENATKFALSGSGSSCALAIADDLWAVDADEGQIAQVIQNIVLNASQAMQHAGTIEISAGNVEIPSGSDQLLPDGGRYLKIRVKDTGTGISPQVLPKIFDPYFTTKTSGSGLGLATSYSIVKRHGGAIRVTSGPAEGTEFCIYLPAAAPETANGALAGPSVGACTRRGAILVMDDEEMVRNVAGKMIESFGYRVELAACGEEAIEKLRAAQQSGNAFDVAILDLTVKGGMGGEEAIKTIRRMAPGVKAVVSSGYADNSVLSDYRAFGFDACLNKPYTIAELRHCLSELLA